MKDILFVDIETFSATDIKKAGAVKYTEDHDFEIILIAYAINGGVVRCIDLLSGGQLEELQYFLNKLKDPSVLKVAHNCMFERTCFNRFYGVYSPIEEWVDTMHLAGYNGLPLSLDAVGEVLRLKDRKIKEGTTLINYFCKPCKATKANCGRNRNLPEHDREKWDRFIEYAIRDVEVCRNIYITLRNNGLTDFEKQVLSVDTRMNERGVKVDLGLAKKAVAVNDAVKNKNINEMKTLTGLENPNSVTQLKNWLEDAGLNVDSLGKNEIEKLKEQTDDYIINRVIDLRRLTGKSSTSKYETMINTACEDNRIRGLLQYAATKTLRWAGRLVQVQNLPQNHIEDIEEVRNKIKEKPISELEKEFDNIADILSQLIRTAFVAEEGHTFLVADYSAIEARVIAWLAGEGWRMKAFSNGEDIYCSSAAKMFGVKVVKHGENGELRQKGKVAELACGYGGGVNALIAFGADKMGLTEPEMKKLVTDWRNASPNITKLWSRVEDAAKYALKNKGKTATVIRYDADKKAVGNVCKYYCDNRALRCELPSGRVMSYWDAKIEEGRITYKGVNTGKWTDISTWGGKLVENIVQAVARDCLATAMVRLDKLGYKLVFSVHDELIAEEPKAGRIWEEMAEVMGRPIDWAEGLLLTADGYSTDFYLKD